MKKQFKYSTEINKKVLDYLKKEEYLDDNEIIELREKAEEIGISELRMFLAEHTGLSERIGELVGNLTNHKYFVHQEELKLLSHDVLSSEKMAENGVFLIEDMNKKKLICLDPYHDGISDIKKMEDLKDVPMLVMSQSTYEFINKNHKELLVETQNIASDNKNNNDVETHCDASPNKNITSDKQNKKETKSKVSILDDDEKASDANSFVYNMLKGSIERGASDMHIDLALDKDGGMGFKLRYRTDGICTDKDSYNDITLYRGIVNKLKLDSGLKIDERRLPQDGRVSFELNGIIYNFRLSFMPNTIRNQQEEKIVLRQMADVNQCDLYKLDILEYNLKYLEEAIKYPHGFCCVTGPTGSGKTTLLYAMLQQIDRTSKNVLTLEDPIEAEIPLINQSQMFHRIGYDFAAGLRVILRQDPDIIMVGEMRDEETASKAFEASNTGHLVFSTLHTNTAASSITRLLQMNVPHYFISSALKFVIAQRLVRRVCTDCRREHPDKKEILKRIDGAFKDASKPIKELYEKAKKDPKIYAPHINGDTCERCHGMGYKGRMAIMEIMKINDEIRKIVNFENGNEDKIELAAIKNGMLTLQQYGYLQILAGLTTFEEINSTVLST